MRTGLASLRMKGLRRAFSWLGTRRKSAVQPPQQREGTSRNAGKDKDANAPVRKDSGRPGL